MKRRQSYPAISIITFLVILGYCTVHAAVEPVQGEAGVRVQHLFDRMGWLIPVVGFLGLLLGAYQERVDPSIDGTRILRHDGAARLSHWTHALGCILLLVSGLGIGFFFFSRKVTDPFAAGRMMDLHFLGAMLFVFGGCYWLANTIISPWRLREHLPDRGSLREGILHYGHIFGLSGITVRPTKYSGSERLALVPLVLFAGLLTLTGLIKLSARVFDLAGGLVAAMTWLHDIAALVMLVLFVFHVVLAAVVPWSWPLLASMFSGWVSLDFAKEHHGGWYDELRKNEAGGKS